LLEVVICDDDKEDLDKATLMLDKILSEYQVQYQIRSFLSANELLNSNDKIDIGILDISMEELGGITLGRKLKEKNHDIKIIYITSYEEYMAQAINKVHAFSFLCKPINEEEMKTQIMEILGQEKYPEIEKEFEILRELLTHQGRILTRQNLLDKLWRYDFYGDERVVDTHIKNLRKKLGIDFIQTIRGVGYKVDKEN